MPTSGLSLVGFMDQGEALAHLKSVCLPTILDDAALVAEWQAAQANLGVQIVGAGLPEILAIPSAHEHYLTQLTQEPWAKEYFANVIRGFSFQLVEIDKLLAFQFTVDISRSDHHCGTLGPNPSLDKQIESCLPMAPPNEELKTVQSPQSMMLRTKCLNLQTLGQGMFNAQFMGLQFGLSFPFVHVVEYNNRYYLHNGFHRALGLRSSGVTHLPCILRKVNSPEEAGIRHGTFPLQLMESSNPPTVGHFTQGRSHPVTLRSVSKILHVSWAEYIIEDE